MKYIVVELQTDAQGNVANIVTSHETRNEAESKYHQVLASAAVSTLTKHAAALLNEEGYALEGHCYAHWQEEAGE